MNSSKESSGEWLNTRQTGKRINQSVSTLRSWRSKKMRGRKEYDLKPIKRGPNGRVYYWSPIVDEWSGERDLREQSPD
ncbi:MAG: hypothetical protein ABUT20_46440 [Bacteroidota bacterium]